MSEHHIGLGAFDKPKQHSFDTTCSQGTALDESLFAAYGINRHVTSEGILTAYPNGITMTRFREGDFSIGYPDNLKHHENKDGLSAITDKHGKAIAYLSAEGNLLVQADGKVLQENKQAEVSLNDISCFNRENSHKDVQRRHVFVLPEITITALTNETARTGEHVHKKDRPFKRETPLKKDAPKPARQPFNWDTNDPLEGADISGF